MSSKKQAAQDRARQIVAAQRRAEAMRRRLTIAAAAVAVIIVAIGLLIVVRLSSHHSTNANPSAPASPADPSVISAVTSVPASVLDTVGKGKVSTLPTALSGQPALTENGKPLVVYMGAEYCPYCAAQRWAAVVALARFGSFTNLGQTHSASADVFPNTPTLSFHGASYTSQYLAFQGVEMQGNEQSGSGYATLDKPTADQQKLIDKYDAAPYVPSNPGAIPFIDFGNQSLIAGSSFGPDVLANKSASQIAAALSNPSDPISQAIGGAANAFTAQLCALTHNQPADVCSSKAAAAYQGKYHGAS